VPELSRILPSHPDEDEPFIIEDTINVYAASMVYRDRHPVTGHLEPVHARLDKRDGPVGPNPQDPCHIAMLEYRIGRREKRVPTSLSSVGVESEETEQERNWRICWEVYRTLVAGINDGTIKPAHVALDRQGRIIPLACKIWIRDLLSLALQRGDAGNAIAALAEANAASMRGAEALTSGLPEPVPAPPPSPGLSPEEKSPTAVARTAANSPQLTQRGGVPDDGVQTAEIQELAEWIFARHEPGVRNLFHERYQQARKDPTLVGLTQKKLRVAFGNDYATKANAPLKGGWPFRPVYQQRWEKEQRQQKCF